MLGRSGALLSLASAEGFTVLRHGPPVPRRKRAPLQDPSSPRGYTQGAAVCLSRLPFFGLMLQRLHSFSTDVIDRRACKDQLVNLARDLKETRFEELGHSAVYQVRAPLPRLGR